MDAADILGHIIDRAQTFFMSSEASNLNSYYKWRHIICGDTVDPVTNDLASARQKKSLVTESRWSQE